MSYPEIEKLQGDLGKRKHDFYRCYKCGRLITREEERRILEEASSVNAEKVYICSCRSMKYTPAWPADEEEWKQQQVLRYCLKLVLAREVAPWAEEHCPEALPHIEWLLSSGLIEKYLADKAWPLIKDIVEKEEAGV